MSAVQARPSRAATVALLVDLTVVLGFAAVGRRNHAEGLSTSGALSTAWPFVVGLAVGWVAARAWRSPLAVVPTGVVVWVATLLVGMLLRVLTGAGTAPAFVVVATLVLAALLVGWRLLARLPTWVRGRARARPNAPAVRR